ncbi:hypothetical protein CC2G_000811 [Coprinopsis cinerea AmutBmut pab1-1]|nr:hypothetical protein CC2G_000811 [Coprinopsis cinerea AmutBmut pab1-1]
MDELLHHCLRELSFDGDLGCDASRLKDFIIGFYSHSDNPTIQNADDAFCSFVWSLVVQHPTVVVGLIPEGVTSEVWVAPQTSAKRKAKASGQEHVETTPARLEPIPNARTAPLEELKNLYGDRLRVALDPDAIFAGITGSHIRTPKLSAMVYTALQIITRGRDEGVTVVELGQKTKYDQKTCFYLVRQLTEMDLVVKVRRGGVGTHFCIHKHFYDRSPSWKAIREEENRAKEAENIKESFPDIEEDEEMSVAPSLDFTPIDSRHLSSLPLVKARVVKLLKASKNQIHASNNMLLTLGFSNPSKTDRRFFQSRIRELIQQGVIEKILVPSSRKKANGTSVKCFRLVSEGASNEIEGAIVVGADEKEDELADEEAGVKFNVTIHKQIIDLLEEAGPTGMTLNDLSRALNNFDKRTIELLLTRAERSQPPKHLADLGIAALMETNGRERRHRYFTVSAYQKLVATEQFDKSAAGYHNVDISQQGEFLDASAEAFYDDPSELHRFQDTFTRPAKTGKAAKRQYKNPILPDGTVKQGRPRKKPLEDSKPAPKAKGKRRKKSPSPTNDLEDAVDQNLVDDDSKRPRKRTRMQDVDAVSTDVGSTALGKSPVPVSTARNEEPFESAPAPRKRGRPPKRKAENVDNPISAKRTRGVQGPMVEGPTSEISEHPEHTAIPVTDDLATQHNGAHPVPETSPSPPRESTNPPPVELTIIEPAPAAEPPAIEPSSAAISQASPLPPSNSSPTVQSQFNTPGSSRGRVNVSHLRRENEILRVIEEAGGIVNIQTKEFYEAHMALLETLAKGGEPTSAPVGTRTDKRTATLTIDSLERKGKVKQLKTSIATHTGLNKPATVVYLPDVSREQLNSFLADIARTSQPAITPSTSAVKIAEPLEYGADPSSSSRGILPLQLLQMEQPAENKKERWSKNVARATQLFKHDDATIRDILLSERTTVGQLYGFIVGKAARAKEFHLLTMQLFESNSQSVHILPEVRILDVNYFCQDAPVGQYTKFVSALAHNDQLTSFFQQPGGQETLVKDLPQDLHAMLQVGRSRSRSRILDTLQFLRQLQLVVPMKPSTGENPFVTCAARGEHPSAFEFYTDDDWTPSTPHAAPTYWYFNTQAPIHLWHTSELNPPLWKVVPTSDVATARLFWDELQSASSDALRLDSLAGGAASETPSTSVSIGRSLRRAVSWNAGYVLTWHQMKFLEKSVDIATGSTILDDADRNAQLQRLSWVTSAPLEVIEQHLKSASSKLQGQKEKIRSKNKELKRLKRLAEGRSSIVKKAEEAKAHREQEWNALIERLHPGDIPPAAAMRVDRVRTRFMQTGTRDFQKWEREVLDALREAELATSKILKVPTKRVVPVRPAVPSSSLMGIQALPPTSAVSASIQLLIQQQQPLLDQGLYKRKSKSKKKAEEDEGSPEGEKKGLRRQRFQWNKDFDELAQDASVIIRARCRSQSRLDWTALEQVFPAVPRNTVRQRLSNLREIPGNDSYLRRLEDRWYELWVKHRGTDELPDEHPDSPSNFELIHHIEFLRNHVDKNALRIGFGQEKSSLTTIIPNSVDQLFGYYHVLEDIPGTTTFDFVWNAAVEEGREKRLLNLPFTRDLDSLPHQTTQDPDHILLGEAALKMVMGSPPETYDCDVASTLLRSVGDDIVSTATQNLLGRGVLSKSQRDPMKQKPGRQLKISDSNQNAIGGSIPRDTYQDATSLLESVHTIGDWREWPLTATDGDAITLIHLVAENQVQFKIDTTHAQAAREGLDWNSKRADDDQIETSILTKYTVALPELVSSPEQPLNELDIDENAAMDLSHSAAPHGTNGEGSPACCRRSSERGVVDCHQCLRDSRHMVEEQLNDEQKLGLSRLLMYVRDAGKEGRSKDSLKIPGLDDVEASVLLQKATDCEVPLLYWVGYTALRIVAAEFISGWTVVTSEQPRELTFPRRWLSIHGVKIPDFWQAALRAVCNVVVFRPGISQVNIQLRAGLSFLD